MTFGVSQFIARARSIAHPRLLLWVVIMTLAGVGACQDLTLKAHAAPPAAACHVESVIPLLVFPLVFSSVLQALLDR